jgi:hypothetical protein
MMLARRHGTGYSDYNVYSSGSSVTTGTTTITGSTGGSAGVSLPTPPSAVAGVTAVTSGTIAPGAYGAINQSGTITLTAGTYIFTTINQNGTINFDTSAGPIIVNVTTGGLTAVNNGFLTNTGTGPATLNLIAGDLLYQNNATIMNLDIFVFNGTATFKNNCDGNFNLYVSGAVQFKNNGTINPNGFSAGGPEILSTVMWTAGSAGPKVDVCNSSVPPGITDPCALAGSPIPGIATVDTWAAVAWQ